MQIPASHLQRQSYSSAAEARQAQIVLDVKRDFELLSKDLATIDNYPGLDLNQQKGKMTFVDANLLPATHHEPRTNDDSWKEERVSETKTEWDDPVWTVEHLASGEVSLGSDGKVADMQLSSLDGMRAHRSHGFLGLGQGRWQISEDHDFTRHTVVLFDDGSASYSAGLNPSRYTR